MYGFQLIKEQKHQSYALSTSNQEVDILINQSGDGVTIQCMPHFISSYTVLQNGTNSKQVL